MTPDELEQAVLAGDRARVLELVAAATEAERRAAGSHALTLQKRLGSFKAYVSEVTKLDGDRGRASTLALLGTGSPAQIRDGAWMHSVEGDFEILSCRPSELLLELGPWLVEKLGWRRTRSLVRAGVMPRPDCDAYIVGMLSGECQRPAALDDPELLDYEVWRLFEVEGTQQASLADYDRFHRETWTAFFLELAASDPAMRARLLDGSLAALERDFIAFRAGWFSRFHEALEPTPEERVARKGVYLRLLRSPIPATVSMAVAAVDVVQKAGGIDAASLFAGIEPALRARVGGTATKALRIVERAAKAEPDSRADACRVVVAALGHGSVEVQERALRLLEQWLQREDVDAIGLEAHRADVAASLLARFDALPAKLGVAAERLPTTDSTTAPTTERTPEPAPEPALDADPFGRLEAVSPIADLPDLVELIAAVLENNGPASEIERVLDGISRLSDRRPPDFDRLTRPIRKRADVIIAKRRYRSRSTWIETSIPNLLASLIVSWVDGVPPPPDLWPEKPSLAGFLAARVLEVAGTAAARRGLPLLAAPTHRGGWIDPGALVERLGRRLRAGDAEPAFQFDLVQALLRLRPDGREEARQSAAELPAVESALALRHALGDDVAVGPTAALWIAAARCRNPDGNDDAVAAVHGQFGAGGATAGRFGFSYGTRWYTSFAPTVAPDPPLTSAALDLPTVLLPFPRVLEYGPPNDEDSGLLGWLALLWPQSRRSWFVAAAARLGHNLDWWEAEWDNRLLLEPLFDEWTEIGREAALLLSVALQCKEPSEQGLAVEAAAHLASRGRLAPGQLVAAMAEIEAACAEVVDGTSYPENLFRPQRLATAMRSLAARSPGHATFALAVLAGSLGYLASGRLRSPVPAGQLVAPLRQLVELVAQTGEPVPPIAAPALERLATGKGEGAKLAARLLARAAT